MAKTKKVFVKCFHAQNRQNNFTKEDFEKLIQNLKESGAFETRYDGFRSIVRQIKKSMHDTSLKGTSLNPIIKNSPNKIMVCANKDESVSFNLYILIIPLSELASEDHFGITSIVGFKNAREIYNDLDGDVKYPISLRDSMISFGSDTDIEFVEY